MGYERQANRVDEMSQKTERNHYLKVRKEGGARVLALTPYLPVDWQYVKVSRLPVKDDGTVTKVHLKIEKVA